MISPSYSFVQSLPDMKIPDRSVFNKYFDDNRSRIDNYYEVAKRSQEMAEEFHNLWSSGKLNDEIETL